MLFLHRVTLMIFWKFPIPSFSLYGPGWGWGCRKLRNAGCLAAQGNLIGEEEAAGGLDRVTEEVPNTQGCIK